MLTYARQLDMDKCAPERGMHFYFFFHYLFDETFPFSYEPFLNTQPFHYRVLIFIW